MKLIDLDLPLPFPSPKDEDWQFTNIAFLQEQEYIHPQILSGELVEQVIGKLTPNQLNCLSIENGQLLPNFTLMEGITISSEQNFPLSGHDWDYFAYLNLQTAKHTIYISIESHTEIDVPLEIDYLLTLDQALAQPRIVIDVGGQSQLILIENCTGRSANYLHNLVLEIRLGAGAKLTHLRCQNESLTGVHTATTVIRQSTNSYYHHLNIDLGAKLSRFNPTIYIQGEHTQTILQGLTIINHNQISDTHSYIHHGFLHGYSQQLHKCILADRSHGIFNGRIFVNKLAQQTEAMQLNRTLLLSPHAKINTKPQLEIIADNVKCKHGATVSQLDPEECFYLQSRGISAPNAKQLLTYSFAGELLTGINNQNWQTKAKALVQAKLKECWLASA